jgi:hypothetical protein
LSWDIANLSGNILILSVAVKLCYVKAIAVFINLALLRQHSEHSTECPIHYEFLSSGCWGHELFSVLNDSGTALPTLCGDSLFNFRKSPHKYVLISAWLRLERNPLQVLDHALCVALVLCLEICPLLKVSALPAQLRDTS